jgi:hypothetical protein
MSLKTSNVFRSASLLGHATFNPAILRDDVSKATLRMLAVAAGLVALVIPLINYSYENPIKGLLLALMLGTPTVRRILCSLAGIDPR